MFWIVTLMALTLVVHALIAFVRSGFSTGSIRNGQKLCWRHRSPPLHKTQGWGTLSWNGADKIQRWATRPKGAESGALAL
jgi:hypothetical protein